MTSPDKQKRPHALVFVHSPQGHWIPTKPLLRQLVNQGISLTVVSSLSRISELQELKLKGELGNVEVELIAAFDEISEIHQGSSAYVGELRTQFYDKSQAMQKLISKKASSSAYTVLLADMFLYWTQEVADELGIPRYTYFTSPCIYALVVLNYLTILAEGRYPTNPDRSKVNETVNVPGLQLFRAKDLPRALYDSHHFYSLFHKFSLKADGILINSLEPCEAKQAAAIRTQLQSVYAGGKVPKVFLIGPVTLLPTFSSNQITDLCTKQKEKSECLKFLDSQSVASVIYICFGSQYQPSLPALTDLARALELSEVPFLWILPARKTVPLSKDQFLPVGFESLTKGRGLVWTGWAPQKDILDHPSIGGFISHCGWNSFMEAIIGGVPIITWPLLAEQRMNARSIVREFKVGIPIEEDTEDYSKEDIHRAIQLLMDSDTGKEVRLQMQKLRSATFAAVAEGGSSHRDLHNLLDEITNLASVEFDHLTISS